MDQTKNVLPCIFEKFFWFTDDELDAALRKRVIFYTGYAPVSGDTVQDIRAALQDLIRAIGSSGEVVGETPYGKLGQKVGAFLFHIDGISQPIKRITFSGQNALSAKQLMEASAAWVGQDFSYTNVDGYTAAALLPLYYQRGYLRSQFGRANVDLLDAGSKGPVTDVSIVLPVLKGIQYSWS